MGITVQITKSYKTKWSTWTVETGCGYTKEFDGNDWLWVAQYIWNELKKDQEPTIQEEEVMKVMEDLDVAINKALDTWNNYVEENNPDEDRVDDIDCQFNSMIVEYDKLLDCMDIDYD